MENLLVRAGILGTAIAALCCLTPVMVVVLGIAGLSAWLGPVDRMMLPMLAFFAALLIAGLVLRRHRRGRQDEG